MPETSHPQMAVIMLIIMLLEVETRRSTQPEALDYLDQQNTELGKHDHKVGIPVVDDRLVIDDDFIRQSLEHSE
jgi:hypothetical protein